MRVSAWPRRKRVKSGTALTTKEVSARYRRNSPDKIRARQARYYAKMMADPVRKARKLECKRRYNTKNAAIRVVKRRELRHRRKAERAARSAALLAWR